jgi:hypothetical protein
VTAVGREGKTVGERAGGEDGVGVTDQQDTECGQHQRRHVGERRQGGNRHAGRDVPDHPDAVVPPAEHRHGGGGEQHGEQWRRGSRQPALEGEEEHQHHRRQRRGRGVRCGQVGDEQAELPEERIAADRDAGELPDLADDHDHRHAGEIAIRGELLQPGQIAPL